MINSKDKIIQTERIQVVQSGDRILTKINSMLISVR